MKKFIPVVFLMWTNLLYAQSRSLEKRNQTNLTLTTQLQHYTDSVFKNTRLLNKCISGCAFARFKVNKKSEIIMCETNERTPAFMDTILKAGISQVHNIYAAMSKDEIKNITRKYFLLPVVYSLRGACIIDTSSKKLVFWS